MLPEPNATALVLALLGLLLGASVVSSRASEYTGIPAALVFLLVGMLAGSEGVLGIAFDDYALAFRAGTIALVLILFDGGLNTPLRAVRQYWGPAVVLATLGIVVTAGVVGLAAHLMGMPLLAALLVGAIVSSTDAAAVFSVLRGSGLALKRRLGATLELESGLNDPLAVLLTLSLTTAITAPSQAPAWGALVGQVVLQLLVGAVGGWIGGQLGVLVLSRVHLRASGLYPALTVATAFLAFGITTLLGGSGFLAAYVAALVVGNADLPYRASVSRVHDALAWLSQIGMFLLLGLLVFPSRLVDVAPIGLALALVLMFVARPVAVGVSLLPFRFPWNEQLFIGWGGLRGAVPIILATYPVLNGMPEGERLFDIVFFVVVVSVLITGGTVPIALRRLRLEGDDPPAPPAVLEISSTQRLNGQLVSFFVDDALDVTGVPLSEIPFPANSAVTLVLRGENIIVPKGHTSLAAGDHVYVVTTAEDRPFVQLLFGRPEDA
ncbi:MAG: potassium/proton antiporter [Gemmatimonadaceae bacterium]|nr:potassium/proton antiporter [Gemmatimonadaceae bacterium]